MTFVSLCHVRNMRHRNQMPGRVICTLRRTYGRWASVRSAQIRTQISDIETNKVVNGRDLFACAMLRPHTFWAATFGAYLALTAPFLSSNKVLQCLKGTLILLHYLFCYQFKDFALLRNRFAVNAPTISVSCTRIQRWFNSTIIIFEQSAIRQIILSASMHFLSSSIFHPYAFACNVWARLMSMTRTCKYFYLFAGFGMTGLFLAVLSPALANPKYVYRPSIGIELSAFRENASIIHRQAQAHTRTHDRLNEETKRLNGWWKIEL